MRALIHSFAGASLGLFLLAGCNQFTGPNGEPLRTKYTAGLCREVGPDGYEIWRRYDTPGACEYGGPAFTDLQQGVYGTGRPAQLVATPSVPLAAIPATPATGVPMATAAPVIPAGGPCRQFAQFGDGETELDCTVPDSGDTLATAAQAANSAHPGYTCQGLRDAEGGNVLVRCTLSVASTTTTTSGPPTDTASSSTTASPLPAAPPPVITPATR